MIGALLGAGADPNAANPGGETALMTAARTGKVDAVTLLLDRGAAVNAREGVRGQTALMWAVLENHPAVVELLIAKGADINAQTNVSVPDGTDGVPKATSGDIGAHGPGIYRSRAVPSPSGAMTALLFAAREGNLEMARILVDARADLERPSANGTRPLVVAIANNHIELALFLLDKGADPDAADSFYKRSPLFAAVERRNPDYTRDTPAPVADTRDPMDVIKALLARGANPNARANTTPFRGFYQVSANWANFDGQTPFLRAALSGDVTLMRLLLEHGADPNIPTSDGATPLMAAAGVNWVVAQTFSRSDNEYPRSRQTVPGTGGRRECRQLPGLRRRPRRREPWIRRDDQVAGRARRQARPQGQAGTDADDVCRGCLPGCSAAGAEARHDRAAAAADGKAMTRASGVAILLTGLVLAPAHAGVRQQAQPASSSSPDLSPRALLNRYCVTCHSDALKTGGLTLARIDIDHASVDAEVWERVFRKLRAGLMPPSGAPRPDRAALDGFRRTMEASVDRAALERPNPGATSLHRLNRSEYANVIRDLLAVDVDASALLPPDDSSEGFDNIADVLGTSPALIDRYIGAAAKISRLAVGDTDVGPVSTTYKVRGDLSQDRHIDGLPVGTRGGILIHHNFPVDGEYLFKFSLLKVNFGPQYGGAAKDEQLEMSVNGERVLLRDLRSVPYYYIRGGAVAGPAAPLEIRLPIKAGPQDIIVTFIKKTAAAVDDLVQRFDATTADLQTGVQFGYTTVPHLSGVEILGPYHVAGPGDTPSRARIFVCRGSEVLPRSCRAPGRSLPRWRAAPTGVR